MQAAASLVTNTRLSEAEIFETPRSLQSRTGTTQAGHVCDLSLITTRAAFDALERDWTELYERAARPSQLFLSFNWLWHWANHYLPADETSDTGPRLAIVTGRRNGRLVMVWPLATERIAGITKLIWMGDPMSQYGDVLVDDLPCTMELLRVGWRFAELNAGADIVRLRKVRSDAAVAPLLDEVGASITLAQVAPSLDLKAAGGFAAYEAALSASARKNRRRLMRRLEERGPVTIETETSGRAAAELAKLALSLKRAWIKDRGLVSPALADPRVMAFFSDVAQASSHSAGCTVTALKSKGEAAAIEIALNFKGHIAIHVITFNLKFEKSGAGGLLMEESIRRAFERGDCVFDLMAPGDAYKMDWCNTQIAVNDWALPLTLAGQAYARIYLGFIRQGVKSLIGAMPTSLRRALSSGLSAAVGLVHLLTRAPPGAA